MRAADRGEGAHPAAQAKRGSWGHPLADDRRRLKPPTVLAVRRGPNPNRQERQCGDHHRWITPRKMVVENGKENARTGIEAVGADSLQGPAIACPSGKPRQRRATSSSHGEPPNAFVCTDVGEECGGRKLSNGGKKSVFHVNASWSLDTCGGDMQAQLWLFDDDKYRTETMKAELEEPRKAAQYRRKVIESGDPEYVAAVEALKKGRSDFATGKSL